MVWRIYDFVLQIGWNNLVYEIVKDHCQDDHAVPVIWHQKMYECMKADYKLCFPRYMGNTRAANTWVITLVHFLVAATIS